MPTKFKSILRVSVLKLASLLIVTQGAIAGSSDVADIVKLNDQIRAAAMATHASDENIARAKRRLIEALQLLGEVSGQQGHGGHHPNHPSDPMGACYDFAYAQYSKIYTNTTAIKEASQYCSNVRDLSLVQYLFEQYITLYATTTALSEAAKKATPDLSWRLADVQYFVGLYKQLYSTSTAINEAIDRTREIPMGRLPCVQKVLVQFQQTFSTSTAIKESIKTCVK